jgi:membrane fusion protein (multidrug efflux system)
MLAASTGCGDKEGATPAAPPPPEVQVAQVVQQDVPIYTEIVGQTRGAEDIEIPARVEGWLEGIHFKEGTEVKKGASLYTIDDDPIREHLAAAQGQLATARAQLAQSLTTVAETQGEVAQARSQKAAAEADVARARAGVAEARAVLAVAEGDVVKFTPLAAIKAVAQRDLDTAVGRRDATLQQVEAGQQAVRAGEEGVRAWDERVKAMEKRVLTAEAGVVAAKGQVEAAEAQVESVHIRLGYTKIEAPVSGLIGKSLAQVGDLVGRAPLTVLNTISRIDPIFVEFALSERDYLRLVERLGHGGGRVEEQGGLDLTLADGKTHAHKGTVNFADREVDPATGTLLIQASFPNPEKVVRPGQFARIRGRVETKAGALLVPQRSVQELQGQYRVYVVGPDDVAQVRPVAVGERVGSLWIVEEGLQSGDRVIVEGLQRVRPGVRVLPREAPPESSQPTSGAPASSAPPKGQ